MLFFEKFLHFPQLTLFTFLTPLFIFTTETVHVAVAQLLKDKKLTLAWLLVLVIPGTRQYSDCHCYTGIGYEGRKSLAGQRSCSHQNHLDSQELRYNVCRIE